MIGYERIKRMQISVLLPRLCVSNFISYSLIFISTRAWHCHAGVRSVARLVTGYKAVLSMPLSPKEHTQIAGSAALEAGGWKLRV